MEEYLEVLNVVGISPKDLCARVEIIGKPITYLKNIPNLVIERPKIDRWSYHMS